MHMRRFLSNGRLLAVPLLLAASLHPGSHSEAGTTECMPLMPAAVAPQVSSAELPLTLQLYRSRGEQAPVTQVCTDQMETADRNSPIHIPEGLSGLREWSAALARPLCEQALHQRTGVFLS